MSMDEGIFKTISANTSPRYRRLENLERWFLGTQYDGMPNWFDEGPPGSPVALWDRAPCIVYPVVEIAIQSNVDLVLGEGRFPVFSGKPSEDESDEENGSSKTEAEDLDRFIVEHHKICQFRTHARDAFAAAQAVGSSVSLHGHRNGIPFAELIPAKTATPVFNVDGEVESLEIQYPYVDEYREPSSGQWKYRVMLYRRTIDAVLDQTFLPAEAAGDGREPNWKPDPRRTIRHGLGVCPVVWYAFRKGCTAANVFDGQALHARHTDEIHQHDIAISQRHRCALLSEPQIYETGVDKGSSPTDIAPSAAVPSTEKGGLPGPGNPLRGGYAAPTKALGRKKGPGYVWQYSNPETKVGAITIPADALKFQDDNARDILHKIENALGVVLPKPEDFKYASSVSGKSIEMMKQRQLDRCDSYRDDLRDNLLIPSVNMQLRIASVLGKQLKVSGSEKIAAIIAKLQETDIADALDRSVA